jgi:hypothetical protein
MVHKKPLAIITILSSLMICSLSSAQLNYQKPRAAMAQPQPILSPYLNLLRVDNSTLSPFHTFVLPQRQQSQLQLMQSTQLSSLQRRVNDQTGEGTRSRLRTGGGGHFQTYLHYYAPRR